MKRQAAIRAALLRIAPRIPERDLVAVVDQALHSKGLRTAKPEAAAWLSAVAYARHNFSDYETMLEEGYDVDSARFFSIEAINEVLRDWGCRLAVSEEEEEEDGDGGDD